MAFRSKLNRWKSYIWTDLLNTIQMLDYSPPPGAEEKLCVLWRVKHRKIRDWLSIQQSGFGRWLQEQELPTWMKTGIQKDHCFFILSLRWGVSLQGERERRAGRADQLRSRSNRTSGTVSLPDYAMETPSHHIPSLPCLFSLDTKWQGSVCPRKIAFLISSLHIFKKRMPFSSSKCLDWVSECRNIMSWIIFTLVI